MRWFKHMTTMLEDPWVQDVFMAEHGIAGYGFICGIYEIYGKECGAEPGAWVSIPVATVTRKLRVSSSKVERWLNDCATAGKLSFEISLRELRINIPKMADLRDEYTSKKHSVIGILSGEYPPKKQNTDTEKEIPPTPQGGRPKKIKTVVSDDWQPAPDFSDWLSEKHPDVTPAIFGQELTRFKNHSIANGKTYADHTAALRNWFDSPYRSKPQAAAKPVKPNRIETLLKSKAIQHRWEPGDIRAGTDYKICEGRGLPGYLEHKQNPKITILASDYEPVQ